jgi:hypothetical protein
VSTDVVGGATLTFEISAGHPFEKEVYGLLAHVRRDVNDLWARVMQHNEKHPVDDDQKTKAAFYFGQNVEGTEDAVQEETP